MNDDVIPLLTVHEYFGGLSEASLQDVARAARVTQHAAGEVVHEANAALTTVGFVIRGRLKALRVDARGGELLFRMIERGDQFGMMIGALSEPVPIRVVALEPTTVLTLDHEEAMELAFRHPELRRLWLRTFAGTLRKHFFGAAQKRAPMVLLMIHETAATRPLAGQLIDRLSALGERLALFSDSDHWRRLQDVPFRMIPADVDDAEAAEIRQQAAQCHAADRIVFDLPADVRPQRLSQLLELADRALYFVTGSAGDAASRRLRTLDVAAHGWRDKIEIAWLLDRTNVAPHVPAVGDVAARDFKIADPMPGAPFGCALASGLERLVHGLRGVRVGVALGGGAARGMSHLGVLKALEEQGIVVDMIAGTSAGAMTGVVYASGLDCDYSAAQFAGDLQPSWLYRSLPRGNDWYLLCKYRLGHFDPMLRKYLHDWRLEQLCVPCLTVAVDLVSGTPVVRDRGDATHSILESINLPVLSVPIIREGRALIDGGLVNNIPADVLVAHGCNFVIAVSVTAKMEREFCEITPESQSLPRRLPGVVQTLLRSLQVQDHNLNAQGVQPADVVIETDVRGFDMSAFTQAKEMAVAGYSAGLNALPRIRQLLTRLDPHLFPLAQSPLDSSDS